MGVQPHKGTLGEHCGTSDSELSHLRATGIRDYLPTPFSHLWRAACWGRVLFLELPAFCAQLSGLQLPERAHRQFGCCAVVYKRIQVTSVAFPPPALSLDL